jgi:hypothetical protein
MSRTTKQVEDLIEELAIAAYDWGVACGEEGVRAHSKDPFVAAARDRVIAQQHALYLYFLDIMESQHE